MINMVKPGTFNPYRMEQFSTRVCPSSCNCPAQQCRLRVRAHVAGRGSAGERSRCHADRRLAQPLSDDDIARYRHELAAYEASRD